MAKITFHHNALMVLFDDTPTSVANARALWENSGGPGDITVTLTHNLDAYLPNNVLFDGKRALSVTLFSLDGYNGTCTNNGWAVASTSANAITMTIRNLNTGASIKGLVQCKVEHSING